MTSQALRRYHDAGVSAPQGPCMRLIHLSNVRLDCGYAHLRLPETFGRARREAVRDAFVRAMDVARNWPADAVLISGNLYAGDRLTRSTRTTLRGALHALGNTPVFIAPGPEDVPNTLAPYRIDAWPENVRVFEDTSWSWKTALDGKLAVLGRAFSENISDTIPEAPAAKTKLVCSSDAQCNTDARYFALGESSETPSFVDHDFGDAAGGFRRVTIEDGNVNIEDVATEVSQLLMHIFSIEQFETPETLLETIRGACTANDAHRVILEGVLSASQAPTWIDMIENATESKNIRIDNQVALRPEEATDYSGTVLDDVSAALATQSRDAADSDRQSLLARAQYIARLAMMGQALSMPGSR